MGCLCYLAVPMALYASARGVWRRSAPWWGAAGLLLAGPLVPLFGRTDWSGLATGAGVLAVSLAVRWRVRAYEARMARWRARREQALQDELRALRRRGRET